MPVTLTLTPYQARLLYALLEKSHASDEYEALSLVLVKQKLLKQEKRWISIEEYVRVHGTEAQN